MLQATDINGQAPTIQPYVLTDIVGTTKYIGTSVSFNDGASAIWSIRKEWTSGTVTLMGYPDGDQDFKFIWNNRAGYTYK